jgi:hypothetical protein
MTIEINTEIIIHANIEKVWSIIIDFENYPNWNPFIKSINGVVKVGSTIIVKIKPPESKGMTFKPKVLTFDSNKELSWLGHLLFPGLFDGEHKFEVVDNGNGSTTFRQSEKFNGLLIPLFKNELRINTKNGFENMNNKLKEIAEQC